MESENAELSWTLRHHSAMRSRTITRQVGRKCEIQTSRTNSHPKFSQTISSKQRSSGKRSQMQGQVRTMMEALQDRKQYRPTTDSAHPTPKLGDRWKSTVWLGKSDLTDEHLVRTDEGVVYARSARRIAEHRWSEEELRAVVEAPQKPKSTTSLLQLTHFLLHLQYQKCVKTRRRNPQRNQRKTKGCRSSHQTQR